MKVEDLEVGKVVVLNSGGPDMTITKIKEVTDFTMVTCTWVGVAHRPDYAEFDSRCIKVPRG